MGKGELDGIVLNTTGPGLIFLHPKSTGGIIMELTDHRMPSDPWDLPNWRRLLATCPHTLIHTEGRHVGLPDGQMGNSEVGHNALGCGRVFAQGAQLDPGCRG